MPKPITVYLPYSGQEHTRRTLDQLQQSPVIERICLLTAGSGGKLPAGCDRLAVGALHASRTMSMIAQNTRTHYTLLLIHDTTIEFWQYALLVGEN